jgi:hypothetical protein
MMPSRYKSAPATTFARCHFCGRENPVSEDWLPTPCSYCGRLHFPASSRSRLLATIAGLAAVALFTVVVWWVAL